ncbi:DNA polymerase III, epsilon subunit [Ruegeria intermedia]|uniref:DNA polymerase III, epsilon subunit n=1 Tax=Ruegeria intermedia TaxID=996115 RepID=A0A1M5BA96_9RHOB|nr:3'-5' exonuclease [Ruegeria intermedia]SHF39345.1 DNA polymerase III, epsilon subunit [Ruegeria intermedia]
MTTRFDPEQLLAALLSAAPARTAAAPRDRRGLYGLIDHHGDLRYVGSTSSTRQTLYERIHQRHRTGSEDSSHYFSRMYNTGRMYRDRRDAGAGADADVAKRLRNAFIAEHCRAVWVPLPDTAPIEALEAEILRLAPPEAVAWNRRAMEPYPEPSDLVDALIGRMGFSAAEIAALDRQRARHARATAGGARSSGADLPSGPFDFVALDVETANNDRASICQIGLAFVQNGRISGTWSSYVDPRTTDWSCSFVHGITARTVRGAPGFPQVLARLLPVLDGQIVFQHSGFERSAINAACAAHGVATPAWNWQDSVAVARRAWPELRGNGGHGLASLKTHLGLEFRHHDGEEDARAAAEVVLRAMAQTGLDLRALTGAGPAPVRPAARSATAAVRPASQASKVTHTPLSKDEIKRLVVARLDAIASVHPAGHQSTYANRYVYRAAGGTPIEIMFEKGPKSSANLWIAQRFVDERACGHLDHRLSPASALYSRRNTKGLLQYGRHSGLRTMPQLERADLVCFRLRSVQDLEALIAMLDAA